VPGRAARRSIGEEGIAHRIAGFLRSLRSLKLALQASGENHTSTYTQLEPIVSRLISRGIRSKLFGTQILMWLTVEAFRRRNNVIR
jgi:hypothetical protein